MVHTQEETKIFGSKGQITINYPAHCSNSLTIRTQTDYGKYDTEKTHQIPFPYFSKDADFFFVNSCGFVYVIQNVHKALNEGKLVCDEFTQQDSLWANTLLDRARETLGFVYP